MRVPVPIFPFTLSIEKRREFVAGVVDQGIRALGRYSTEDAASGILFQKALEDLEAEEREES